MRDGWKEGGREGGRRDEWKEGRRGRGRESHDYQVKLGEVWVERYEIESLIEKVSLER